jgi:uncharacterized protein (TIGR02117 family)
VARLRRAPRRRGPPLLGPVLLIVLVLGLATARSGDRSLYPPGPGAPRTTIYLVDNDLHSDIALPRAALAADPLIGRAVAQTSGKAWILVGWGDARFYRETGLTAARAADAARALLSPHNASVVHLEGLSSHPDMAFVDAHARAIEVSDAGLAKLLARIDRSLAADASGAPIREPGPAGPDEGFYRSGESFSLVHLCNHWTGQALNAAGLPVDLALDTLPAGLRLDLALRAWLAAVSAPGTGPRSAWPPGRASSTG